jgi:hypothetical protein
MTLYQEDMIDWCCKRQDYLVGRAQELLVEMEAVGIRTQLEKMDHMKTTALVKECLDSGGIGIHGGHIAISSLCYSLKRKLTLLGLLPNNLDARL